MLWAPCFTGAPLHAPGPPCPQRGRPSSPQRPAAQVRLGGRTRRWSPVLVPLGSSANPSCPLGLFLSPPRSQDPTPTSAPQEATDGGKVAEPSGEPLPTVCLACLPAYRPPAPRSRPPALHTPPVWRTCQVSRLWTSFLRTAPCRALVSFGDLQATLRGTSSAPKSYDR